jgi:phytoene dehydrogenase-like protein
MVLVPSGHLNVSHPQDWRELQSRARSKVIQRLADIGVTDLEAHIKFEYSYTPRTWLNKYNLARGASLGSISHNVGQVGYLRPQNRHKRYNNLYFVGASTHPGSGLPLVLMSAKLTVERIKKETSVL